MFPDKPTKLRVTNVTSGSSKISWTDPKYKGVLNVSQFCIKVKENDSLLLDITTGKVNEYQLNNLNPFTEYEVSVTSGNSYGFSEESTITSFRTSEVGK